MRKTLLTLGACLSIAGALYLVEPRAFWAAMNLSDWVLRDGVRMLGDLIKALRELIALTGHALLVILGVAIYHTHFLAAAVLVGAGWLAYRKLPLLLKAAYRRARGVAYRHGAR